MKHLTPYRQNETSLSPVSGRGMVYGGGFDYKEDFLLFYPVFYIKSFDMTEVLYIVIFLCTITLVGTRTQFSQYHVTNETTLTTNLIQPLRYIMVIAEEKNTCARVKQILFHNSISLLLTVLLSRISLIISSAERLSFQAPTKRFAQSDSDLAFLVVTNDFTKASIFVIADSLSRSGLISRNNSARNSIAVIIVMFFIHGCKGTKIIRNNHSYKKFL